MLCVQSVSSRIHATLHFVWKIKDKNMHNAFRSIPFRSVRFFVCMSMLCVCVVLSNFTPKNEIPHNFQYFFIFSHAHHFHACYCHPITTITSSQPHRLRTTFQWFSFIIILCRAEHVGDRGTIAAICYTLDTSYGLSNIWKKSTRESHHQLFVVQCTCTLFTICRRVSP